MRILLGLLLCVVCVTGQDGRSLVPAPSVKALVIGINNYPFLIGADGRVGHLQNSVNDAEDFAALLTGPVGVPKANVKLLTAPVNGSRITRDHLEQAVADFYRRLQAGDTAIFFYSGHGVQVENDPSPNFLVPSDLRSATLEVDLKEKAYPLSRVIKLMEAKKANLRLLFVDACRNNPLIEEQRRVRALPGGESVDTYRPPQNVTNGTVIGYAVSPGEKALDRSPNGRNGMYTYYLLRNLPRPGVDVIDAMRDLAAEVHRQSGQTMTPSYYGNILARVSLVPAKVDPAPPPKPIIVDRSPKVGDTKVNPKDGLTYVWIPPGRFVMGCSPGDNDCADDEKPPTEVSIQAGFWLGQTPVTVRAWKRYVMETGKSMPPEPKFNTHLLNEGWRDDRKPIVNVNWNEASAFCGWAGGRLPTEAEWEYAARAGTTGRVYGNIEKIAWTISDPGFVLPAVAEKQPNAWLLFDLFGVRQWIADGWTPDYKPRPRDVGPPLRVIRGSRWYASPGSIRVSYRGANSPQFTEDALGLRCVSP